MFTFTEFFTDPILRGPTMGSMLMGLSCALIGSIAFLQKRALVGEAISHATFPGVAIGVMIAGVFSASFEGSVVIGIALFTGLISLLFIEYLIKSAHVQADAALCLTLSLFLGVGLLIASQLQLSHAQWYRQIHLFLYGQAATMGDEHVKLYALFSIGSTAWIIAFYKRIQIAIFDPFFSRSITSYHRVLTTLFSLLLTAVIVIGIRSVGVVLMSGMLIAPPIAARRWTHRLSLFFVYAAFIGFISAFLGNYLSVQIPKWMKIPLSLATGPMMVLSAAAFAFLSLFFSPQQGLALRLYRRWRFQVRCMRENLLKSIWKGGSVGEIKGYFSLSSFKIQWHLERLRHQGYLVGDRLTPKGEARAIELVRAHRLWEVYLSTQLGLDGRSIHESAGEVEHLISSEEERLLTELLGDPEYDPHHQPIPKLKQDTHDS